MIRRTTVMSTIALCIAGAFGAAQADSNAPRLLGENGVVRSALSGNALASADRGSSVRERMAENRAARADGRMESISERAAERDDRSGQSLVGLEETDEGTERSLTLGRLKASLTTDSNRAGEDSDDQPAGAAGKLTVGTVPADDDVKGSSVTTGLAVKGPSPESDEGRNVGGNVETTLKAETPQRDDNSETNSYGGKLDVGLGGVVIAPDASE